MNKNKLLGLGIATLLALLLVGGVFADSDVQNKNINTEAEKLVKKIEKELRETEKYSEEDLKSLIRTMEKTFNVKFNEKEKKIIKEYIVREIKKKIKIEKLKSRAISIKTIEPKKKVSNEGITYNIVSTGTSFTFYQPLVDIVGGSGYDDHNNYYNVEGNNNLYKIEIARVPLFEGDTNCPLIGTVEYYDMYTLYYYDEDHRDPWWDEYYDWIRQQIYGRTEDIETFYVRLATNLICFDDIWSNDETFYPFFGQHGFATFSYTPTIYIATWNHAMDVDDDNPSLSKIPMP